MLCLYFNCNWLIFTNSFKYFLLYCLTDKLTPDYSIISNILKPTFVSFYFSRSISDLSVYSFNEEHCVQINTNDTQIFILLSVVQMYFTTYFCSFIFYYQIFYVEESGIHHIKMIYCIIGEQNII